MRRRWIGVDVGGARKGFDLALIDDHRLLDLTSHLSRDGVVSVVAQTRPAVVGVDSPRRCAPPGRTARDCERVLNRAICGIRWTPDCEHLVSSPYYSWVVEGLKLFHALAAVGQEAIEVFPTASWTRWIGRRETRSRADWSRQGMASLGLSGLPARASQDQRDAIAAAVTARQHSYGETEIIGDIVVPAAVRQPTPA